MEWGGGEIGPVLQHLWLPSGVHVLHNHIRFISHTGRLSGRIYEILLLNQIFTFILPFPVIIVLYLCTVINHPSEVYKSEEKTILQ